MQLLEQALSWWRKRYAADLSALDEFEISRIAREFSLSSDQLAAVNQSAGGGAALLARIMLANGLDVEAVRRALPDVLRDLEVHCSLCREKGRCQRQIETGGAPKGFEEYCPNALTLLQLQRQKTTWGRGFGGRGQQFGPGDERSR